MTIFLLALAVAFTGLQQEQLPRAIDLLEQSGHTYEKSGTGWAIKFKGNNQNEVRVFIVQTDEMLVLGSVLAFKNEIGDRPALMESLLNASDDYDYVKTTIDNDGDYATRMDLEREGLTTKRFNDQLMQIATVTDLLKPIVDKYRKK
jgi:hypothetical protein